MAVSPAVLSAAATNAAAAPNEAGVCARRSKRPAGDQRTASRLERCKLQMAPKRGQLIVWIGLDLRLGEWQARPLLV